MLNILQIVLSFDKSTSFESCSTDLQNPPEVSWNPLGDVDYHAVRPKHLNDDLHQFGSAREQGLLLITLQPPDVAEQTFACGG